MQLTENRVFMLYDSFKKSATLNFEKNNYDMSLRYWQVASSTAYSFFLDETDKEIEEGLSSFSRLIKTQGDYVPLQSRCVFYDAHSVDKGALTQQYIRAVLATDWDMLYITEKPLSSPPFQPIKEELEKYPDKVTILSIPSLLKGLERVQFIYDKIVEWGGDKLFMHLLPDSVAAVAAFQCLPKSIVRYQINHTDHTYIVGTSCVDYCFEFRPYGCNLSVYNRGLASSKLLLLPYYPIESPLEFQGFPFDRKDKIVIFSGGNYYKTIDENDTYMEICKKLLNVDERIVIVYAGWRGENLFQERLKKKGISTNRFFTLGFRKDISAIFDNCDFYLNTYPIGGALMCQYAARHAVPILCYHDDKKTKAEEVICQIGEVEISSISMESLQKKVQQLIEDKKLRKEYGEKIKSCCVTAEIFNKAFIDAVNKKRTPFPIVIEDKFTKLEHNRQAKLDMEDQKKFYHRKVVRTLGFSDSLLHYPIFTLDAVWSYIAEKRFMNKQ